MAENGLTQAGAPPRAGSEQSPRADRTPDGDIMADGLVAFDVSVDGTRFRMSFAGAGGADTAVSLPADCLQSLVMTLPKMMQEVLRARHRDDSLRLVYPAHGVRLEQASEPATVILTLGTPDGFEVSFALRVAQLAVLAQAYATLSKREAPAVLFN